MRVIKITDRHERDFWADMECEFCNHKKKLNSGYDDAFYWQNVIPEMVCESCGKTGKQFKEHREEEIQKDLCEIAHYYGGWPELRKMIDQLEEN